jgi:hypothetical protein
MTYYSDDEIRSMAKDVVDHTIECVNEKDYIGYRCSFCLESSDRPEDIKHKPECVFLVAKRVLGRE